MRRMRYIYHFVINGQLNRIRHVQHGRANVSAPANDFNFVFKSSPVADSGSVFMWVNGSRTKLGHAGRCARLPFRLRQIKLLKSINIRNAWVWGRSQSTERGQLGWAYGFNRGLHKALNGPELNFDWSSFRFISLPHVAWPIAALRQLNSCTAPDDCMAWHVLILIRACDIQMIFLININAGH